MQKLRDPCRACARPLDPSWKICPYCESQVGTAAATPRRTRRRREDGQPAEQGTQPYRG